MKVSSTKLMTVQIVERFLRWCFEPSTLVGQKACIKKLWNIRRIPIFFMAVILPLMIILVGNTYHSHLTREGKVKQKNKKILRCFVWIIFAGFAIWSFSFHREVWYHPVMKTLLLLLSVLPMGIFLSSEVKVIFIWCVAYDVFPALKKSVVIDDKKV